MEELRNELKKEILDEIEKLKDLEPGSKEYANVVDGISKLYRVALEDQRDLNARDDSLTRTDLEIDRDNHRYEQDKRAEVDRWLDFSLRAAGIVLPLAFYGTWMHRGLKYEETGSLTSSTFRGLINKFNPTKI